ncbi:hypothetical protein BGZ96_001672 [Linnemannia gamsii]|uniref:Uncharacterized protein n=1 Tax=Linnemannia gamsii TaxID=64522 RepID=A0ABQ7JM24_9FUNG|nr:hypothetical protein BGZ96_001672 [Linnemannia gamsii]
MEVQTAALPIMPVSTSTTSTTTTTAAMPTPSPKNSTTVTKTTTTTTTTTSTTNDPFPTWTFFPDSATYTPPVYHTSSATPGSPPTTPSSPPRSPRSSPSPQTSNASEKGTKGQATSSSTTSASTPSSTTASSSTPSTHHRILDHCFHVSIETRLKQAEAQYQASRQEQAVEQATNGAKQDDWRKRQRSLVDEAVVLGRKGSNVEAIVDGILKSHRSNGPLQTLPRHIKIRLHLCQLTSMVFGRFDVASSTNSAGLNVYSAFHSRRHGVSRAAIKQRFANSERGQQMQPLFSQPIPASDYCRRHHRRDCKRTCCTLAKLQQEQQLALELKKKLANSYFMNTVRKQEHQRVAGLVDAIPAFLKCSAMSYRDIVNNSEAEHKKEKEAKEDKETDPKDKEKDPEQENGDVEKEKVKVLEGWYKLLLEMMTQAVLESYLCDENTGFDTILDVFSFGDDPNKEEEEVALKDIVMEDVTVASSPSSSVGVEGLHFQSLSGLGSTTSMSKSHGSQLHDVTTKDRQDDILFAKTPEYFAFKQAKDDRLQEFLTLEGDTMEHHLSELAEKYPLIVFERQMTHFIARAQQLLVDPKLSQNSEQMGLLIPPTTSAYADGSLSMPVSEDEDDDDDDDAGSRLEEITEEDEEDNSSVPVIKKEKLDTNETIDEQKRRLERASTPLVAVKQEGSSDNNISMVMEQDDDDNSTAARVVQVSKKHKHQAEANQSQDTQADTAAHLAKKAKMSP